MSDAHAQTKLTRTSLRLCRCGLLLAAAFVLSPAWAQTTATWTGAAGTGNWSDPNNWDIGRVPVNGDPNDPNAETFNVVIPDNVTVQADLPPGSRIVGLSFGNSTLNLNDGQELTVEGVAVLDGLLQVDGPTAGFFAPSQFAVFQGGNARVLVSAGAIARIAAPSYTHTSGSSDMTVLSARGSGSVLEAIPKPLQATEAYSPDEQSL